MEHRGCNCWLMARSASGRGPQGIPACKPPKLHFVFNAAEIKAVTSMYTLSNVQTNFLTYLWMGVLVTYDPLASR